MNVLISHIEYLLTQYDCVIIPGFGGFVLRYQPSVLSAEGRISPPCKIAAFNASLTHNDGMLANSLMREKNIPFSEAMILIESEVRAMHSRLQQGQSENLNSLGSLRMGEEGELDFTPSEQNLFDLSIYGFSSLTIKPLYNEPATTAVVKEETIEPDIVMVPVNVRILRRVCAVAILVIGLLCISHPLDHGTITQHYASLISSSLLKKAIVPDFSYTEDVTDFTDSLLAELSINVSEDSLNSDVVMPDVEDLLPKTVEVKEIVSPVKRYYIIIGSFPTEQQARKRVEYLSKRGIEGVQYLLKDNKYRLYVNTFADKMDANTFLKQFKATHPDFSDAWLLAHRS